MVQRLVPNEAARDVEQNIIANFSQNIPSLKDLVDNDNSVYLKADPSNLRVV